MFWVISCRFVFWLLARQVHTLIYQPMFRMLFLNGYSQKNKPIINQWFICFLTSSKRLHFIQEEKEILLLYVEIAPLFEWCLICVFSTFTSRFGCRRPPDGALHGRWVSLVHARRGLDRIHHERVHEFSGKHQQMRGAIKPTRWVVSKQLAKHIQETFIRVSLIEAMYGQLATNSILICWLLIVKDQLSTIKVWVIPWTYVYSETQLPISLHFWSFKARLMALAGHCKKPFKDKTETN